ncbi:transcription repressor NadR [Floccifex sp.]|uniref:transcription repressor NadR n=1 Tax=Floccifex sp. TaxID=2815810 RepID=UPI003F08A421
MTGQQRREEIIDLLKNSNKAIPGKEFALRFSVSRQVIVQDIALLRAKDYDIVSTNHGYILNQIKTYKRVFKVFHNDEQTKEEMECIIDCGGCIEDVFIYHRSYGTVKAQMGISSRRDIQQFLEDIQSGKSTYLKNVTSNYHYHTVSASSEKILDFIQRELEEKGFLASLQDYEPDEMRTK